MVKLTYSPEFSKQFKKLKDEKTKSKIIKLIMKLKVHPELGKPMKFERKGTRELYISPYRLSYAYFKRRITCVHA